MIRIGKGLNAVVERDDVFNNFVHLSYVVIWPHNTLAVAGSAWTCTPMAAAIR